MPHDHRHETEQERRAADDLSPRDKLEKMVEYWLHHNEEHVRSYRDWANRARALGEQEAGEILDQLAHEAVLANGALARLLRLLTAHPASR